MAKNSESIDAMQHVGMLRNCGVSVEEATTGIADSLQAMTEDNKPPAPPSQKKKNDLTVKVDIDVSDALKGLKAVQREAKNTARALREVEELSDKRIIDSLTDDEIFEELATRGWDMEANEIRSMDDIPYLSIMKMERRYKPQN